MSNYEYIIASLPFLTADFKYADGGGFHSVIAEIKRDLDEKDAALVDFLLKGFNDKELTPDYMPGRSAAATASSASISASTSTSATPRSAT